MSPQAPSSSSTPVFLVEARLRAADDLVADEERQHVVAVLALRLRDEHLEPVAEVPQRLGAVAVVDEAVEGGEEDGAVGDGAVLGVRMRLPLALDELHALRAKAPLLADPLAPSGSRPSPSPATSAR